ncbi:MAG: hypothetical protein ABJE10_14750 [bacterium]
MTTPARAKGDLPFHPTTLLRAYSEITGILQRLRESRGILEQAAVDRLAQMNDKLKEVSSATEMAATDIMNGLDRTIAMANELDVLAEQPGSGAKAAEVRAHMREELFGLMIHLQFQDIITQQLAFAASIIVEMEQRLAQIVGIFDTEAPAEGATAPVGTTPQGPTTFDPNATTSAATNRQTVADEIFLVKR